MNLDYDDLTTKAKEQLEPAFQEAVEVGRTLLAMGRDVYVAADLAAYRCDLYLFHEEILRRLKLLTP